MSLAWAWKISPRELLACEEQFGPETIPMMADLAAGTHTAHMDRKRSGLADLERRTKELMAENPDLTVDEAVSQAQSETE